jgi:hypothetical protein
MGSALDGSGEAVLGLVSSKMTTDRWAPPVSVCGGVQLRLRALAGLGLAFWPRPNRYPRPFSIFLIFLFSFPSHLIQKSFQKSLKSIILNTFKFV